MAFLLSYHKCPLHGNEQLCSGLFWWGMLVKEIGAVWSVKVCSESVLTFSELKIQEIKRWPIPAKHTALRFGIPGSADYGISGSFYIFLLFGMFGKVLFSFYFLYLYFCSCYNNMFDSCTRIHTTKCCSAI